MKRIVRLTENDISRIVKRVMNEGNEFKRYLPGGMNEALGLLGGDSDTPRSGRKMPKNYPTKHITSMESAVRYTMGSKVSAKRLFLQNDFHELLMHVKSVFLLSSVRCFTSFLTTFSFGWVSSFFFFTILYIT